MKISFGYLQSTDSQKKNSGQEEKLNTVKLGGTDLEVSEVGFGGIPIIPLPKNEAVSIVKHCFDLGMTLFDTANMYLTSEEKIGTALEPVRDKVVIASKTTQRDANANEEALQQILAPQGAYEALAKARDAGKIRFIGISSHSIQTAMEALQTGLFQTLQFPFNFIENDPENELFPFACQHNVGIIGMKPLGGGLLESADLCFGFLQQHPHVVPIPGIRAKKEADQIIALYRHPQRLSRSDLKKMQTIRTVLGEKFCHRCEYCMPCEQGVQIPSVLIFQAVAKRLAPESVSAWLGKAMESVSECIECGQCEEKCPYNLPVADLLKENLALFKKIEDTNDLPGT
jgi:predicted aldo/keto reductase-like oxidoreductase